MPRLQITPDQFKAAKLVKPGWYPTLIKDVVEELAKDKQSMNIVMDLENADRESEFIGVPCKHWFTEKFPTGAVAFVTAASKQMGQTLDEKVANDFEFNNTKGLYIYAKWGTNRGKDGTDPPRNSIEDWAPLPAKYAHLNANAGSAAASAVAGFDS